eukprot:16435682-Heterocapsa_arctica.AAC.1
MLEQCQQEHQEVQPNSQPTAGVPPAEAEDQEDKKNKEADNNRGKWQRRFIPPRGGIDDDEDMDLDVDQLQ